jgi:hypothetical protein
MSDLNLIINQDAANRSVSLVNRTGSGALPVMSLPLVFADIYTSNLQFVNSSGTTSSYFNTSGSTATLALGLPGEPALAAASCSFRSSSSYSALFQLNTNELSASLGSNRSRQYVLELQVISGSSVITYQNPCVVYRDVVTNALYPLNINYIVSASYATTALSSSYASTSSWANNAKSASYVRNGDITLDSVSLRVGSGDETVTIDTNEVSVAGVVFLSNQGFTAGFSAPDITTISNGSITAPRITGSFFTGSKLTLGSGVSSTIIQSGSGGIDTTNLNIKGKLSFNSITEQVIGTVALVGGTASVATPSVASDSVIFLTGQTAGANAGELSVGNKVNGASFAITSSNLSDTRTVGWFIVENIV